jgi:Na+-transporting methylmalonyl-CoA/oxaloacetate decarboxylase gamma subunit
MSFLGLALFLLIFGMAFWMLLFLMAFILPLWITLGVFQQLQPKKIFDDEETEK